MSQKYKSTSVTPVAREKAETLPIAAIKNKFDVRVELDQDRVIQFAGMYQSDVYLPPIEVIKLSDAPLEYAFIDGRTRAAARQYLNLTDVQAIVRNGSLRDDPAALYARALEANWGGAKPPTRADIAHTILRMLESGISRTEIKDILTFLPPGAVRGYTADALSVLSRRKIGKALDAINDGTSIEIAAQQNNLKLETLKDIVAQKKGKWGKSRTLEVETIARAKTYISQVSSKPSKGIGNTIMRLLQSVEDGEISASGAAKVIKYWRDLVHKTTVRINDWEARLQSIEESQRRATGNNEPTAVPVKEPTVEAPKAKANGYARPKTAKRSAEDAMNYVGERMGQGFWNEELPKAIRATGARQARPLVEYFAGQGKQFSFKQVDGALQRLKKRGMSV